MRAIVCHRYGEPDTLRLEELTKPSPVDDQLLVRVHAAAVNDYDLGLLRGSPAVVRFGNGFFTPRVRVLGCDVAGRVEAAGPAVTGLRVGDEVFGDLSECGFGAFADYVCVPERALRRKPASMSFAQAAALPHAAALAMQALFDVGRAAPGKRILLNGAGGGVGTLGLQMLRQWDVEVTCVDRADKLDMLRELGADHVIDYRRDDFTRLGRRYDLIVDTRTNRSPGAYVRALTADGTYATVGGLMRRMVQLVAYAPWAWRRHQVRLRMVVLEANAHLEDAARRFESGQLAPVLDRTFPLERTVEALGRFASAAHLGKVMIAVA